MSIAILNKAVNKHTKQYPFGMLMQERSYTATAKGYRFGFNGQEGDDEVSGSGNAYDFGARIYDSRLGRWMSVDPLWKRYLDMSTYNGMGNNPIFFIDIDGERIVVPNCDDRAPILEMINSKAAGTFAFNEDGELYQVSSKEPSTTSKYYADKLLAAIDDDQTIEIRIAEYYWLPSVELNEDGKYELIHKDKGLLLPTLTDEEDGGGVTVSIPGGENLLIYISGNEIKTLRDTEEQPLEDKPADILLHELVGHAIPKIIGSDTGNAVENENKARDQIKDKGSDESSPLRKAEPGHKE